jgi:hypothetical protein
MYEDDHYHPSAENDYDYTNDDFGNDLNYKDGLNVLFKEAKQLNYGFNRIKRRVCHNGKWKKHLDFYTTSSDVGSTIRDAETGEYYDTKVGSMKEHLYFKATLATGECNSLNGSNTLFYLTPEKYEKHFGVNVPQYIKEKWYKKKNEIIQSLKL